MEKKLPVKYYTNKAWQATTIFTQSIRHWTPPRVCKLEICCLWTNF